MKSYNFYSSDTFKNQYLKQLNTYKNPVAIYSSGHIGRQIKKLLEKENIPVLCFINEKHRIQNGECDNIPIFNYQTFLSIYSPKIPVINCENHNSDIPVTKNKVIPWYMLYYGKQFSYSELLKIDPETWCFFKSDEQLKKLYPKTENILSFFYINVCITQKCNLKCKYCSHLIPLFNAPIHYELVKILQSIDRFLDAIDYLHHIGILGGEPFLHPDLINIVNKLLGYKKIGYIEILTNGTYIPSDSVLEQISDDRILIRISDYGCSSDKLEGFVSKLIQHKILYQIYQEHSWHDYGLTNVPHLRNVFQLKNIFQTCSSSNCYQIKNSKLYHCAYSGSIEELHLSGYPNIPSVNLLSNDSAESIRSKILQLKSLEYISICDFCNGDTGRPVKPGLQK